MEVTTWQRWSLRLYADDIICGSLSLVRAMHGGRKDRLDATKGAKNQMTQWNVDVKALARYGRGNRIEKRCNGQRRVDVGYILAAKSLWHHWSYLRRLGIVSKLHSVSKLFPPVGPKVCFQASHWLQVRPVWMVGSDHMRNSWPKVWP